MAQGWSECPEDTYASTPFLQSVRHLLVIATLHSWPVRLADVTTAFLHAPVEGEVFVRPPPAHSQGGAVVWRLKRALYGL